MNASLVLRTILLLALAIAPASSTPAQPKGDPAAGPSASHNRQAICSKLEGIRFETVVYDGLPLGEVVIQLRDETVKRDPEKRGINFMVNPSSPARVMAPGQELPGAIDVDAIAIRIRPPLKNVRLVDVLEAVVKVADHPIQYTIEEYGVVFALREATLPLPEFVGFNFPGGTPREFLEAVQKQYKVDWLSVADIPRDMAQVRIPKLRISPESLGPILMGSNQDGGPLEAIVSLYNQLSEQKPDLGRLIIKGSFGNPAVVMFAPDKSLGDTQPKIKVKAFSIYGLNESEMKDLQEDIERATEVAMQYSAHQRGPTAVRALEGRVATHKETSLLVATGPESYVDMVESIVTAAHSKHRAKIFKSPTLPAEPPKNNP